MQPPIIKQVSLFAYSLFDYRLFIYSFFAYSFFAYHTFTYRLFVYHLLTYRSFTYHLFTYRLFASLFLIEVKLYHQITRIAETRGAILLVYILFNCFQLFLAVH